MIQNFMISKYFSFFELTSTNQAQELLLENRDEAVPYIFVLAEFCRTVLDVIREALNGPVIVTSGFRGARLNGKIGGKHGSKHQQGIAADIWQKDWTWEKLLELGPFIYRVCLLHGLTVKIILEKRTDTGSIWMHVNKDKTLELFTGIDNVYEKIQVV